MAKGYARSKILYGAPPRTSARDEQSPDGDSPLSDHSLREEIIAVKGRRAGRAMLLGEENVATKTIKKYEVGDYFLVAMENILQETFSFLAFEPKFCGPCLVIREKHLYYELESKSGRKTLKAIHDRRSVRYHCRETSAILMTYATPRNDQLRFNSSKPDGMRPAGKSALPMETVREEPGDQLIHHWDANIPMCSHQHTFTRTKTCRKEYVPPSSI